MIGKMKRAEQMPFGTRSAPCLKLKTRLLVFLRWFVVLCRLCRFLGSLLLFLLFLLELRFFAVVFFLEVLKLFLMLLVELLLFRVVCFFLFQSGAVRLLLLLDLLALGILFGAKILDLLLMFLIEFRVGRCRSGRRTGLGSWRTIGVGVHI